MKLILKHLIASISGDMAKRIMYSALLAKSNKDEYYGTDGVVNQSALDSAAAGVNDIIKFGTMACLSEMRHAKNKQSSKKVEELFKSNNIKLFLESCIDEFNDKNNFMNYSSYGGHKWATIAKSLLNLFNMNENLKSAIKTDDYNKQNKIKKMIVLELNYFDSLNHNSDSILSSLLNEESGRNNTIAYNNQYDKVKNLLDLKDLKNTNYVFNKSFDVLKEESGTAEFSNVKHKFTDRIENFNEKNHDLTLLELNKTRFNRNMNTYMNKFDVLFDVVLGFESNLNYKDFYEFIIYDLPQHISDFNSYFGNLGEISVEFKKIYNEINKNFFSKLNLLVIKTEKLLDSSNANLNKELIEIANEFEKILKFGRSLFLAI